MAAVGVIGPGGGKLRVRPEKAVAELAGVEYEAEMHPRISIDPAICHGKACVRGTRIPVAQVLGMLASGDSAEEILQDFPSLESLDIQACLAYGAALAEEQMTPLEMASSTA